MQPIDDFTRKLYGVLDRVSSFFPGAQKKPVSPVSTTSGEDLSDPGLLNYYQKDQAMSEQGKKEAQQPAPTYPPFQFAKNPDANPKLFAEQYQKAFGTQPPGQQTPPLGGVDSSKQQPTKSYEQPVSAVSQVDSVPKKVKGVDQNFIDYINTSVLPKTRAKGIPDALAVGQAGSESQYGKAAKDYNYWGLMSFKGGKRHLASFKSLDDAVQYYSDTVKNIVKNNTGKTLDQINHDPLEVLKALQGKQRYEGDNKDPLQYVYDVSNNAVWQEYGGGQPLADNPSGGQQPPTLAGK